jgi:ribosomal protein S18 acetylase RimI-like enzyme
VPHRSCRPPYAPVMTDPRIAPVEDNLLAFWAQAARSPMFRRAPADDVIAVHCDVAFPMFNAAIAASFADAAKRRTHEVVDSFMEIGLPWLWWLTPSHTSPEIEAVLQERGLVREEVPGMYRELAGRPEVPMPAGVEVRRTDDLDAFLDVMILGYGLPALVTEPMGVVMRELPEALNVLATLDGRPVASGTAYLSGPTAGVYNIAVLEEDRGRGIGYAVTATLLDLAADAGARHAVLHSSADGFGVYERLGFVEVCETPQYLWLPEE